MVGPDVDPLKPMRNSDSKGKECLNAESFAAASDEIANLIKFHQGKCVDSRRSLMDQGVGAQAGRRAGMQASMQGTC